MTENINNGWGSPNSTQRVIERSDSAKERSIAAGYARALFWHWVVLITWLMLPLPVLVGRDIVTTVVVVAVWRLVKPLRADSTKYMLFGILWVIAAGGFVAVLMRTTLMDALWIPVRWGWVAGHMTIQVGETAHKLSQFWLWIRAILIVVPPLAWYKSYRFAMWRYGVEIVQPTASSTPVQPMRPSSVHHLHDSPVRPTDTDSDPPPVVELQPARLVPYRVQQNAVRVPMLTTNTGDSVERDKVLDMIEAQHTNTGFAYDTWRVLGMTRTEWKTALALLVQLRLITIPERGKTTTLLTSVDDALDVIEGL